jgi:hypothetical protein
MPANVIDTDAGTGFMAGLADRGSVIEAQLVTSLGDFIDKYGDRVSYSVLYDSVETFFEEGGARLYISRIVGPAAVHAGFTFLDAGAAESFRLEAKSPGEWGNALNGQIIAGDVGGEFKIVITHDTLGVLETSPSLVDKAAAAAWVATAKWVRYVDKASALDPATGAAQSFVGGADDRASITDAQRTAALNRFLKDLGPGQVAIPGSTTSATQQLVEDHALANNRTAFLDGPDTPTVATLTGIVAALRSAATKRERFSAVFAPWDVIPGLTSGTTRVVPPVARQMGKVSKLASMGFNANKAAAGDNGEADYVIGLSQPRWTDAERDTLNSAGINVSILHRNRVTTYGWRTLADPNTDRNWLDLGGSRFFTQIQAEANDVGEHYVFEEIDGQGRVFRRLEGDLKALLLPYYGEGSLYGNTQQEAFAVDTGPGVNTPQTIADREINADVGVRISPHGEIVRFRVSKVNISEAVA